MRGTVFNEGGFISAHTLRPENQRHMRDVLNRFPGHLVETIMWWPDWEPHGHLLAIPFLPGEKPGIHPNWWEDLAAELAESVMRCNETRHNGRGKTHSHADVEAAFATGYAQLASREGEHGLTHLEMLQRMWLYQKWGGHVPTAMIMPLAERRDQLTLMVPDEYGQPHFLDIRKEARRELEDVMPLDLESMVPDASGIGLTKMPQFRTKKTFMLSGLRE